MHLKYAGLILEKAFLSSDKLYTPFLNILQSRSLLSLSFCLGNLGSLGFSVPYSQFHFRPLQLNIQTASSKRSQSKDHPIHLVSKTMLPMEYCFTNLGKILPPIALEGSRVKCKLWGERRCPRYTLSTQEIWFLEEAHLPISTA